MCVCDLRDGSCGTEYRTGPSMCRRRRCPTRKGSSSGRLWTVEGDEPAPSQPPVCSFHVGGMYTCLLMPSPSPLPSTCHTSAPFPCPIREGKGDFTITDATLPHPHTCASPIPHDTIYLWQHLEHFILELLSKVGGGRVILHITTTKVNSGHLHGSSGK